MFADDILAVAIDIGSFKTAMGYVGTETPDYICESIYGKRKSAMEIERGETAGLLYAEHLLSKKEGTSLHPIMNSSICNSND